MDGAISSLLVVVVVSVLGMCSSLFCRHINDHDSVNTRGTS